jgi:hypothetical protein
MTVRCVFVILVTAFPHIGCSPASRLESSTFLSELDLQSIVNECSPSDAEWAHTGFGEGSTSKRWSKHYGGDLNCGPDSEDIFLRCLGDKFKDLIDSSHGEWTDVRASSSDLAQSDLRLDYEVDSRKGQIRVTLKESGDDRFPTTVYVQLAESTND